MITIKQATVSDVAVLRDIGIQTYTEHFSAIWSPAGMQGFLDKDFSPNRCKTPLSVPRHIVGYSPRMNRHVPSGSRRSTGTGRFRAAIKQAPNCKRSIS